MLLLSRKEGQSFYITISADADPDMKVRDLLSEPIQIEVTKMNGGIASIGIMAPRVFYVAREEIYDENKALMIEVGEE